MANEELLEDATDTNTPRLIALLIDMLFLSLPSAFAWGFGSALVGRGAPEFTPFVLLGGLIYAYKAGFELYRGQTPGKRYMNLRVATENAVDIDAKQALVRNVPFLAYGIPLLLPIGLFVQGMIVGATSYNQRLADLLVGAYVMPVRTDADRYDEPWPERLKDWAKS